MRWKMVEKSWQNLLDYGYSYLIDEGKKDKKSKDWKKWIIKRKLKFEIYKNCFEATQLENKINLLEKDPIGKGSIK